jgi:[acyl-carrier-protein] S-malonyltransferase
MVVAAGYQVVRYDNRDVGLSTHLEGAPADAMAAALAEVKIVKPAVPVVANVLARPIDDPDEIRKRLVEQVTGTVRWRECVEAMGAAGVTSFYEIGSGKVLSGLVKRILKEAAAQPIGTPADIEAAWPSLKT